MNKLLEEIIENFLVNSISQVTQVRFSRMTYFCPSTKALFSHRGLDLL